MNGGRTNREEEFDREAELDKLVERKDEIHAMLDNRLWWEGLFTRIGGVVKWVSIIVGAALGALGLGNLFLRNGAPPGGHP